MTEDHDSWCFRHAYPIVTKPPAIWRNQSGVPPSSIEDDDGDILAWRSLQ